MKLDPLAPLELVRANDTDRDPALDVEAMGPDDVAAYYKGHDARLIKLKPGVQPTVFVVKAIPALYVATVLDPMRSLYQAWATAFLAACHEVRVPGSAEPLRPAPEELAPASFGVRVAPPEWLEVVTRQFALETVYEIGMAAIRSAKLPVPRPLP